MRIVWLLMVLGVCSGLWAQGVKQFVYQGRIVIAGRPFTGTGSFKFVLLDAQKRYLWNSGERAVPSGIPPGVVRLPVTDGVYMVTLGDARLGMRPVDPQLLARTDPLALRIWFDDGAHGLAQLGEDQPITPLTSGGDKMDEILRELREIRLLLEQRDLLTAATTASCAGTPATALPAKVGLALRDNAALGSPTAPLTMVEFTDFQCEYCRKFNEEVFPELKRRYIDTGKLRYIGRILPLPTHPQAEQAAQAALCAGAQGKYWEMHDLLFKHHTALQLEDIKTYAGSLGLNMTKFTGELTANTYRASLTTDIMDAWAVGITGTPTFIIGKTNGTAMLEGDRVVGFQTMAALEEAFTKALGGGTL